MLVHDLFFQRKAGRKEGSAWPGYIYRPDFWLISSYSWHAGCMLERLLVWC